MESSESVFLINPSTLNPILSPPEPSGKHQAPRQIPSRPEANSKNQAQQQQTLSIKSTPRDQHAGTGWIGAQPPGRFGRDYYAYCSVCYSGYESEYYATPFIAPLRCTFCGRRVVRQGPMYPTEDWECQVNYGKENMSEDHLEQMLEWEMFTEGGRVGEDVEEKGERGDDVARRFTEGGRVVEDRSEREDDIARRFTDGDRAAQDLKNRG